jgi:hypothetical protein
MRRVVVTGMGIVSSIGNNADEVTESLRTPNRASASARISPITASAARSGARRRWTRPTWSTAAPCASCRAAAPGTMSPWSRRSPMPGLKKTKSPTSAPASSWARADRRPARSSNPPTSPAKGSPKRDRPVRGAQSNVVDRIGHACHLVQDPGRQLFDLVGLLDLGALHRQRHGDDPVGQAGHGVCRRPRGSRLDAVEPVRRHGRDVLEIQRHADTRLARL